MDISKWGRIISKTVLTTRMNGLGTKKTTAVVPKLIFLHRNEICGYEGTPNYDLKQLALECSRKRLYPKKIGA